MLFVQTFTRDTGRLLTGRLDLSRNDVIRGNKRTKMFTCWHSDVTQVNRTYKNADVINNQAAVTRDVKCGIQIGSDCPQTGQIWDFLRSVSVHFGAPRQNELKLILKSPRFAPFGTNLPQ